LVLWPSMVDCYIWYSEERSKWAAASPKHWSATYPWTHPTWPPSFTSPPASDNAWCHRCRCQTRQSSSDIAIHSFREKTFIYFINYVTYPRDMITRLTWIYKFGDMSRVSATSRVFWRHATCCTRTVWKKLKGVFIATQLNSTQLNWTQLDSKNNSWLSL